MPELPAHHLGASHDTPDDGFIDDRPQPRPVLAGQDLLPGQTDFKQALDLIGIQLYWPVPEDIPRIRLGLEQPRHDDGLEVADGGGTKVFIA